MADFCKLCKCSQAAKAVSHPSTPVVEGREGLTHLSLNSVGASPKKISVAHWFMSLADARRKMEDWRRYYNEERPHGPIGNKPAIMLLNHDGATGPPS
jgi:transposase InsO family protein